MIEDWAKLREGPNFHDRGQPLPTRQHPDDFNPREVTFGPTAVRETSVHFVRHCFARVRSGAFQDFRIVVVQPLKPMISIQRLNARPHPTTEIAIAVGVNFYSIQSELVPFLQFWPELSQRAELCSATKKNRDVPFQRIWIV